MEKNADIARRLREAGFKATPGRIRIIEALGAREKPMTVGEVAKGTKGKLNETTLYRALEAFAQAGIVRRVDLHHSHAHYELQKTHHHHLVCTNCGAVEDVAACAVEPMEKVALRGSRTFASIMSHDLEFFGTCKTCTS
ncbi:MAG TPA: Fur family transcriptional regulator [Candidatus Paceibacterota bacterium]|nr:Fur family transcriptional regulator [Candidatus Paceibacterota bacterium]